MAVLVSTFIMNTYIYSATEEGVTFANDCVCRKFTEFCLLKTFNLYVHCAYVCTHVYQVMYIFCVTCSTHSYSIVRLLRSRIDAAIGPLVDSKLETLVFEGDGHEIVPQLMDDIMSSAE